MKIGRKGIALIKSFESLRLKAYQCPAGIWTIGYGHTGPDVTPNLLITEEHANQLLAEDVGDAERGVSAVLKQSPTQEQFDAMVSLAFNIGAGAFSKSTVLKKFNSGDVLGASKAFALWNKVNGKESRGLIRRRMEEAALFLESEALGFSEALPQTGAIEERHPKPVLKSSSGQVQAAGVGLGSIAVALGVIEQISDKLPQLEALVALVRYNSGSVLLIVGAAAVVAAGFALFRQWQHGGRS